VAYGDGRDFAAVMINIDSRRSAAGPSATTWSMGSYQELAGHPLVYDMIQQNIEETNRSLAEDNGDAGAQVKRFLILHKELDADDGEVTRTRRCGAVSSPSVTHH